MTARGLFETAARLHQAGRLAEAVVAWDRFLAALPGHPDGLSNKGSALAQLGETVPALACFEAALATAPDHRNALANAARLLGMLGRPVAALALHRRHLAVAGDTMASWFDAGLAAIAAGDFAQAAAWLATADAMAPGQPQVRANLAFALGEAGRAAEAVALYDRLLADDPAMPHVAVQRAFQRQRLCDWREAEADLALIRSAIADGAAVPVLSLLALVDEPALHGRAAGSFLAAADVRTGPPLAAHPPGERLRLAYVSGDVFAHATMYLIAGMLAAHDRQRFEITLVAYGPAPEDEWRARARAAVDHFLDVDALDDGAVATLLRERRIDVAIDLKGLTFRGRPGIFTARAAPVQASWLGFPGSVGAAGHDYVIADRMVIPDVLRGAYPEAVVRLPGCYQPNAARWVAPAARRSDHGLGDGTVFTSFNQAYKITPAVFGAWMAILAGVPDSQLWLLDEGPEVAAHLRRAAATAGVAPARLVFAPKAPLPAHLARLGLADLLLDTFPYNSHTTASDAIGMGVPVLTMAGTSFASRVAASLNYAAGMDDLTVADIGTYVGTAIRLGRDPAALAALKARAMAARAAPLFDSVAFTRPFEAAVLAMDARHRQGQAPGDIDA